MARTPLRAVSRRALLTLLAATLLAFGAAERGYAWRVPVSAPPEPACPPIPDASDLHLTGDERQRVDAGEIVLRILRREERGGLAQAVGYLDANPAWLFEIATDSSLADGMADVIRDVQVLETRAGGKVIHGVARPSVFLPSFQYTISVSYLDDGTGQCWAETEGDFVKNEGSHSYLWDPVRGQTLAVFTFEIELKGMLRVLPQSLVMRLTARTLPSYMRSLEASARRLAGEDIARASRVASRWRALLARLETDQLSDRVWSRNEEAALNAANIRQSAALGDGGQ
jgi:hypothetical protein